MCQCMLQGWFSYAGLSLSWYTKLEKINVGDMNEIKPAISLILF